MPFRLTGALVLALSLLATVSLQAIDAGRAEGTVTINRKPIKLKYAFAKKDKDFDEKDRWVVVLTDRAVTRSLLGDDSRLGKAVDNGQLVAAVLTFDADQELVQAEVKSKALQHRSLPINSSKVKVSGAAFSGTGVEAAVATTGDSEFFSDVAVMSAKFHARVGPGGRFGESAAASAELAASRPKLSDGGAVGTVKIGEQSIKLAHSIARTKPNTFDAKRTDVVVLLTNVPATEAMLLDDRALSEAMQGGTLRGVRLSIDEEEKPYYFELLDPAEGFQMSGSGIWDLDVYDFSDKHVTAKFSTAGDFVGKPYSSEVTFAVPVLALRKPDEITVDETSGTALPANGGDPGKAYMAFDKAVRAGNVNEMKKYASEHRPMPDLSPADLKEMLSMIRMMRPVKIKVTGGFLAGDRATLSVQGEDGDTKEKMGGTIEMANEGGTWRVVAEKWRH